MNLLELASLVITPNAYEEGKLFSVIPSNGTGDLEITRSTTKTRVNPQGLIETIGINAPSIDYSGGGCPSILLEPQRTNLIPFSNNFSGSGWGLAKSGVGLLPLLTGNFATSPDGTNNASRIVLNIGAGTTSSDISELFINVSNSVDVVDSRSIFMKSNTADTYNIYFSTGLVLAVSPNAWARAETTLTGVSERYRVMLRGSLPTSKFADILIFGAQVEQAGNVSSYIPTNGAAVTRNQDSKVKVDDLINKNILSPTEGSIFVKFGSNQSQVGSSPVVSLVLSVANRLLISVSGGTFRIQLGLNNLTAFNYQSSIPMANSKCGVSYNNGQYKIFINGSLVFTSGIFEQKAYTSLQLSDINTNGGISSVRTIDEIYLYKTALSDQECIQLTTP